MTPITRLLRDPYRPGGRHRPTCAGFPALPLVALVLFALAATASATTSGDEVSTRPPAEYTRYLAPLLTDAEQAVEAAASAEERMRDGEIGSVLLAEELTWVGADGRVIHALHRIYRANSEEGVEAVARETIGFRRGEQTIHLVRARTLAAGGEWVPARPEATFVQSPQKEAEDGVYTDLGELVILFPQVESGAAVEVIAVTEERFRVPGEYTDLTAYQYFWPADEIRRVIELPADLAYRARVIPVGTEAPEPERTVVDDGRVRYEWRRRDVPSYRSYAWSEPIHDRGPAVWLSTLESWGDFADWYRGLLAGRAELSPALEARVEEWTAGLEDPMDVLRTLHSKVADDVRYTGLEFGIAGYQPKPPTEVWHDRFGDCKDKANLLRALLAHVGIRSHLVLVDTGHAGEIETRSPDFRHFDHAILGIETSPGSRRLLFADPTIPHLPPGRIGSSADRPVLVIRDSGYQFVRTPPESAGELHGDLDLELRADGGLQGWVEIEVDGVRSVAYRSFFEKEELWQRRANFETWMQNHFPGAEVVDVETEAVPGRYRARLYLLAAGDGSGSEAAELIIPRFWSLWDPEELVEPTPGDLFQRLETTEVDVRYRLPVGRTATAAEALSVDVPGTTADGAWTCGANVCTGRFVYRQTRSRLPAAELPALARGIEKIQTWHDTPPEVVAASPEAGRVGTATVADAAGDPVELLDFPRLASGAGQLRLVERRYPEEGDHKLRGRALDKVIEWFPDETDAVFEARVRRADLDCMDEDPAGETAMRETLSGAKAAGVDRDLRAWGRFMLAGCATVEEGESLRIYRDLLADEKLGEFRRGWSAWNLADLLGDAGEIDAALAVVREGLEAVAGQSETADSLIAMEIWLRAGRAQDDRLPAVVASALEGERAAARAEQMVDQLELWESTGDDERVEKVHPLLVSAFDRRPELDSASRRLESLGLRATDEATLRALSAELAALFDRQAPDWWDDVPLDEAGDAKALRKRIEKLGQTENRIASYLRHQFALLTLHPPHDDFAERLLALASVFDHFYSDAEIVDPLLRLVQELPRSAPERLEAVFVEIDRRARRQGPEAGLTALDAAVASHELPAGYRLAGELRRARFLEATGRTEDALAAYAALEPQRGHYIAAHDADVERLLLLLEIGEIERALSLAPALLDAHADDLAATDNSFLATSLSELAEDREGAAAYWRSHDAWFQRWRELARGLGWTPEGPPTAPRLGNVVEFGERIGLHLQQEDLKGTLVLLDEFLRAVRWSPELLPDAGLLLPQAIPLAPDVAPELRDLGVEILGTLPAEGPGVTSDLIRRSRLARAALLVDRERFEEAAVEIEAFFADGGPADNLAARMRVLSGLVALGSGEGIEQAAKHLQASLGAEWADASRGTAVSTLADLYREMGDAEAEIALLERELRHPAIRSSARAASFEARLEGLRGRPEETAAFEGTFESWFRSIRPPWWEHARPHEVDGLEELEETWLEAEETLVAEKVKAGLVLAGDASSPVAERKAALGSVVPHMGDLTKYLETSMPWIEGVAKRPDLGEDVVPFGAFFSLLFDIARVEGDFDARMEELRRSERWKTLTPPMVGFLEGLVHAARFDRLGPEAVGDGLEELLEEPLDEAEKTSLKSGFDRLLSLGAFAAAEVALEAFEATGLESGDEGEERSLAFELRRDLRQARDFEPMVRAICGAWDPTTVKAELPARWFAVQGIPASAVGLPRGLSREHLRFSCRKRSVEPENLEQFLAWEAWTMDGSEAHRDELVERTVAAVEAAPDDEAASEVVLLLYERLELDDPAWERILSRLKARARDAERPRTRRMLHLVETARSLRAGEEIRWRNEIYEDDSVVFWHFESLRLRDLARREERKELKKILAGREVEDLLDAALLDDHLRAARVAGDPDVLGLLQAPLEEEAYRRILGSWSDPSWSEAAWMLELAEAVGRPDLYPRAWVKSVAGRFENEVARARFLLLDARLQGDDATAGEMAQRLLGLGRVDADLHWDLARAAEAEGDLDAAGRHAGFFLDAVGSHDDLAEAKALRDRVAASGG